MIDVWWVRVGAVDPALEVLLDPGERDRLAALRRDEDRARLRAGAVVLRLAAGRALGEHPADVALTRSCPDCDRPHGRPQLAAAPGLHVSVSHSGDLAVVALSPGRPVGVDAEVLDASAAHPVALALTAGEQAELAEIPAAGRAEAFLRCWVAKEAVLKAGGQGLRVAPTEIELDGLAGAPRLRSVAVGLGASWRLLPLRPPAGYAAALAVWCPRGREPRVREHDAADLLGGDLLGGDPRQAWSGARQG